MSLPGLGTLGAVLHFHARFSVRSMAREKKSTTKTSSRNSSTPSSAASSNLPSVSRYANAAASPTTANGCAKTGDSSSQVVAVHALPCGPPPSELFVEAYLLAFLIFCLFFQNLNVYQQNWYLIDMDLVLFSIVILARNVMCKLLCLFSTSWTHSGQFSHWVAKGIEVIGKLAIVAALLRFLVEITLNHGIMNCLFLAYPLFLYTSLFGFTLDPHQERLHSNLAQSVSCCQASSGISPSASTHPVSGVQSSVADVPCGLSERADVGSGTTSGTSSTGVSELRLRSETSRVNQAQQVLTDDSTVSSATVHHELERWQSLRRSAEVVTAVRHGPFPRGANLLHEQASQQRFLAPTLLARTGWPRRFLHWGQQKQPPNIITCCQACLHNTSSSVITGRLLSSPPNVVRREVECLWSDFLVRVKQLIFNSVVCAYYAGFIPMQFVQHEHLYFQRWWCALQTLLICLNSFVFLTLHLLPAQYCGSLYQCAMQLGFWDVLSDKHTAPHTWSAMSSWPCGSIVRHPKGIFQAIGSPSTVATPGDEHHESFYLLFTWALYMPVWLQILHFSTTVFQLITLFHVTAWQQTLAMAGMILFSCYPYVLISNNRLVVDSVLEMRVLPMFLACTVLIAAPSYFFFSTFAGSQ